MNFDFGAAVVRLCRMWRIEADDGISVGTGDDGQKYNYAKLPSINLIEEAKNNFGAQVVSPNGIRERKADALFLYS